MTKTPVLCMADSETPVGINRAKRILMGLVLAVAVMFPHLDATAAGPLPVYLGSAGRFAVLAATEITSIPTSAIKGDVGISPAARSSITGLTPVEVDGRIFAPDDADAGNTKFMLEQAKDELTTAYNDAAGRTPVPVSSFLNPGGAAGIGGLTLVPGLYKFTSDALIAGSNPTLNGSASDVWIFQIGTELTVANGIQVVLAGGAQESNIFWQVGTSATLGTGVIFKGTIMAARSIALQTLARLDGRALARNGAVTLDSNTITIPGIVPNTNSITLLSAAVVTGPYQPVSVHSPATRTITVPMSGSMQFYRIRAGISFRITSITISGGNVVVITFN